MIDPLPRMKTVIVHSEEECEQALKDALAEGLGWAAMSNAGLPRNDTGWPQRLTFLPESAFKKGPETQNET